MLTPGGSLELSRNRLRDSGMLVLKGALEASFGLLLLLLLLLALFGMIVLKGALEALFGFASITCSSSKQ